MNQGRWYPTGVTLSNGNVLVMGGTFNLNGDSAVNTIPQIWDARNGEWITLTEAKHDKQPEDLSYFPTGDYYPFLYASPNDHVFNAGPQQMARYLKTIGWGEWQDVAKSSLEY